MYTVSDVIKMMKECGHRVEYTQEGIHQYCQYYDTSEPFTDAEVTIIRSIIDERHAAPTLSIAVIGQAAAVCDALKAGTLTPYEVHVMAECFHECSLRLESLAVTTQIAVN